MFAHIFGTKKANTKPAPLSADAADVEARTAEILKTTLAQMEQNRADRERVAKTEKMQAATRERDLLYAKAIEDAKRAKAREVARKKALVEGHRMVLTEMERDLAAFIATPVRIEFDGDLRVFTRGENLVPESVGLSPVKPIPAPVPAATPSTSSEPSAPNTGGDARFSPLAKTL